MADVSRSRQLQDQQLVDYSFDFEYRVYTTPSTEHPDIQSATSTVEAEVLATLQQISQNSDAVQVTAVGQTTLST